jgi:DNA primase
VIPDSKIDEVRERIDLVALMGRHGVELKKSGRSFKGCCPFHQEKTPSFHVWPEERRFKCFGCQAGGDAFSFMQRLFGKPFLDAVRDLAKEAGVDLDEAVDPSLKEKAQIKDATDVAAEHFKSRLWDPVVGKRAREYLTGRGVGEDIARAFGLGWAPLAWTELADQLRERGLVPAGEKAGLVSARQRGDGHYDMFRGRLIIPIRSPEGRTIAFGGRLLEGDDGPKYLNSRESKLYNKSDTLYGLDQARDEIRRKKSVVLCEGYFDCIGLHKAGVKNAVALCSTALTPGHMTVLARAEAKELVLLLDGDEAGRKAIERLAAPILASGGSARVAALPDGEDPDTWAAKVGAEAVQRLVEKAPTLTEYLFKSILPGGASSSFEAKMGALERIRPIATGLAVGLMRSAFFGALSAHMGLPASELESALKGKAAAAVKAVPKGPVKLEEKAPEQWEALFAVAVLRNARLLGKDEWRAADELKHTGLRNLVAALSSGHSREDALYEASDVVKRSLEEQALQKSLPEDELALEQAFLTVCRRLKLRGLEDQLTRLSRELAQTGSGSDLTDEARELLAQQGQLLSLKRQIQGQKA